MPESTQTPAVVSGIGGIFQKFISVPLALVVAVALWPVRVLGAGIRQMRDILGLLIFLGVGVLIAAAALWYITTVVHWWRSNTGPPSIGAVTVLGLEDARAKAIGAALPAMILAELRRLGERTNEAKRQLQELEQTQTRQASAQDPRFEPVPVPESLKTEVVIPQQIAGVEIGWLLAWLKDLLAPTNVIDLTASYEADGKKATVFGHAKGRSGYAFMLRDDTGRPDEIVRAAAAAIIQHEQRRGEIAVQPLPPSDYLPVVDALSVYATYERVSRSWKDQPGRPDFTPQYQAQLASIEKIAETYLQWSELQWLAAEIAERAGDRAKALVFTVNEQRLTPRDDPRYRRLAARLERLAEANVATTASPDKRKAAREAAGNPPVRELAAVIKKAIGVPDRLPAHGNVRIGVIGTPWPESLKHIKNEVIGRAVREDETLADYTTGVVQAARMIAPDSTYVFVGLNGPGGMAHDSDLLEALNTIIGSAPDILIFGFGPATQTILTVLRRVGTRTIIVTAAGNSAGTSSFAPVDDVVLNVGATDLKGSPTNFSDSSSRAVWAPGEDIPTISSATGELSRLSGTSHAAAIVAGASALLKATYPAAKSPEIGTAMRESAKPPFPTAAKVIDVNAAMERLGQMIRARGAASN